MTAIPFAAKALVGTVPAAALLMPKQITLHEMVEDFCSQLDNASAMIDNIMQSGSSTFIVHCKTERDAESVLNCGLCFRGQPLVLKPAPNTTWVKLTRVVYGTTDNAIKSRLSDYGTVLKIRRETVNGIGISVFSVKIELKQPIPSRITIAHYPVNVFYRGQVQQCFRCEQTGHISKHCPKKKQPPEQPPAIVGPVAMDIPPVSDVPSADAPVSPLPDVEPTVPSVPCSSISAESMETGINAATGKRQISTKDIEQPAKVRKMPSLTYVQYEKDRVRLCTLGDDVTDEDYDAFESSVLNLPDTTKEEFRRTFLSRHPLLLDEFDKDVSDELTEAIAQGTQLTGSLDISDLELLHPTLPSDLSAIQPMVEYAALEATVKPGLLRSFGVVAPSSSKDQRDKMLQFRDQQPALAIAYMDHFYTIYPELMDKSNLTAEKKAAVTLRICNRDT